MRILRSGQNSGSAYSFLFLVGIAISKCLWMFIEVKAHKKFLPFAQLRYRRFGRLDVVDYFLAVVGRFHFSIHLGNLSLLIDEVSDSSDPPVLSPVQTFLLPGAVLFRHFVIHVRKQRKVQSVFLGEFLMSLFAVRRYTKHHRSELLDGADVVPESARLNSATRC